MSEGDSVGDSVHGKPSVVYRFFTRLGQGWYIVTYALGIYHLNLFIAFLSPKVDPSLMEDSDDGPSLPTKQNEEFRPFIRRLPEFKFWHSATKGILVAMVCTFFEAFNVPVFWPILVMYFIMLFCITMKRQIKGILVAMVCTFFEAFNVPVFWPILVMYFIMLFCITMKRQIKHMIKYRYIPFTHGKRTYKGKEDAGKTFAS
ncbi:Protein RER1 [Myotis brandtii]|uniref:Protein RER1 n=1 Tax=Myotis brandtii TaxID=109478 RepID=S7N1J2_MYOBR|nr:Protein RER1 [Myotis brandtii]